MKNIKQLFSIQLLQEIIIKTVSRFPISSLFILLIAWLFFTISHGNFSNLQEEKSFRMIFSLVLWFFLSVWIYITTEDNKFKYFLQFFPIVFSISFYFRFQQSFDDIENTVLFFLTFLGIIGCLAFAPYLKNIFKWTVKESVFYSYFYNLTTTIFKSLIVWWVLFSLWAIGIAAIHVLFDFWYSSIDNLYWDWAIITLSILAPFFMLTQLPNKKSYLQSTFIENKFFSFLIKYTATPFIVIYFLILYAYTIKVLSNFSEWPKGEVSWLVIGFSIFWYITYIFSYIFEKKNENIALFRRIFPWVVFPQIFMLFYAIYLRVEQYDLTINRYFVIVFGLWLLGVSLYYMKSHTKRLITLPASLTLITLLISIGPWSVYNLPVSRQLERLKGNLIEANILQDGVIIPLNSANDISAELSKQIYGGIEYLCKIDSCNSVKTLFPEIYKKLVDEYENTPLVNSYYGSSVWEENNTFKLNSWEIISGISEKLKVQNYFEETTDQELLYISLDYTKNFFPINVDGYSEIFEIRGDSEWENTGFLNVENQTITLPTGKVYDISEIISQLLVLINTPNLQNPLLDPELLTFEQEWVRIYIRNVNIYNPNFNWEKSDYPYYWAQWYILIP